MNYGRDKKYGEQPVPGGPWRSMCGILPFSIMRVTRYRCIKKHINMS